MERWKSVFFSLISLTMSLWMLHVCAFENKGLFSLNLFSAVCCKSVMILVTEVHVCVLGGRHRVFCDINIMSVYIDICRGWQVFLIISCYWVMLKVELGVPKCQMITYEICHSMLTSSLRFVGTWRPAGRVAQRSSYSSHLTWAVTNTSQIYP